ncbi:hypothetical protein [Brucella grignonensis]|uniref:Uncharacterized protein n=1 Tax=Brucella grignonensis TaxID=94627 RepID=A0A256EY42_9HYPH|nr:hypothetical protein [Brucella grignonensis]OYR07538.1 hypothetical protein CEV33_3745 [Brucella grignonensis]
MTSAIVEKNLKFIAGELINKGEYYEPLYDNEMPYEEQIISIFEYIDHGEYGVAYENLICLLERSKTCVSAKATVKIIEVSLLFGFKTERLEDRIFDRRLIG